jgi:DNA-3-methyladenine glycosylase I
MAEEEREQPGKPTDESVYLEQMTRAIFSSGFSWQVIQNKWPNFLEAFAAFSIDTVAGFDERDVERLSADEGIVRNVRKIQATIENARKMREEIARHGSFHNYLRSLDELDYDARSKALVKRFGYLGRTGAFVFLWRVGESVPDWEDR